MRYSGAGVLDDWKAIAAILASLVAMVGGAFGGVTKLRAFVRERRTGFDVRADSSSFVVGQGEAATVHIYGRLRLRAHARGSALSNVQARLVSSDPALTLGGCVRIHQREFYLAFRTAHDHMAAMPLSPGEARYVDIVRVRARDPAQATLMLADTPSSPSEGYVLLPGHYTLGVRVTAVETRARS